MSIFINIYQYLLCNHIFFYLNVALAMDPPAHYPVLCKKALRAALSLNKKQPQTDLTHCRHEHCVVLNQAAVGMKVFLTAWFVLRVSNIASMFTV